MLPVSFSSQTSGRSCTLVRARRLAVFNTPLQCLQHAPGILIARRVLFNVYYVAFHCLIRLF